MILASNHLMSLEGLTLPANFVLRVNLAYVNGLVALNEILQTKNDVFLDFPKGRRKPPFGNITLAGAIGITNTYNNIKYFAISNTEDSKQIETIKECLPSRISVVPKIETIRGVLYLQEIINKVKPSYVMLDTEDLFTDIRDIGIFTKMCSKVEAVCNMNGVKLLKLSGVIFCDTMHS